jgi:hypothetical protein
MTDYLNRVRVAYQEIQCGSIAQGQPITEGTMKELAVQLTTIIPRTEEEGNSYRVNRILVQQILLGRKQMMMASRGINNIANKCTRNTSLQNDLRAVCTNLINSAKSFDMGPGLQHMILFSDPCDIVRYLGLYGKVVIELLNNRYTVTAVPMSLVSSSPFGDTGFAMQEYQEPIAYGWGGQGAPRGAPHRGRGAPRGRGYEPRGGGGNRGRGSSARGRYNPQSMEYMVLNTETYKNRVQVEPSEEHLEEDEGEFNANDYKKPDMIGFDINNPTMAKAAAALGAVSSSSTDSLLTAETPIALITPIMVKKEREQELKREQDEEEDEIPKESVKKPTRVVEAEPEEEPKAPVKKPVKSSKKSDSKTDLKDGASDDKKPVKSSKKSDSKGDLKEAALDDKKSIKVGKKSDSKSDIKAAVAEEKDKKQTSSPRSPKSPKSGEKTEITQRWADYEE